MTQFSKKYMDELKIKKDTIILPISDRLNKEQCNCIITTLIKEFELQNELDALVVMTLICQSGATSPAFDGNRSIGFDGKEFQIAKIRKIFNQCKAKNGMRKFARNYANEMYNISKQLGIKGNLCKKIKNLKLNEELKWEIDDDYWLSDFQAYNPNAPERIRKLIIESFPKKQFKKKIKF